MASMKIATASPSESSLSGISRFDQERQEHDDHQQRRGADDPPGAREPERDRIRVAAAPLPILAHPREQEDLVVHGEPEQDREQERRDPVGDVPEMVEPSRLSAQPHWKTATITP